jgi:hypothetical protein
MDSLSPSLVEEESSEAYTLSFYRLRSNEEKSSLVEEESSEAYTLSFYRLRSNEENV